MLAALPFLLLAVISLNTAQALNPEAYAAAQRRLRGMWRPRSAAYALAGLLGLAGATYLVAPTQPAASLRWQPATVVGRRNLSGTGLVQTGDLADRVVVVTFFATWCTPCRAIAPTLDRMAVELDGRLIVAKVDVDENPAFAQQFGVQGIPTLLMVFQGKEISRVVGALPEAKLKDAVADFLSKVQTQAGGLASGKSS